VPHRRSCKACCKATADCYSYNGNFSGKVGREGVFRGSYETQ
jgi:hypothetical protein